jgi:hypothetical protein
MAGKLKFQIVEPENPPRLILIPIASGIAVPAAGMCDVKTLFRGGHINFRDGDLDIWLRPEVPAIGEGKASSYKLGEAVNFTKTGAEHLGGAAGHDDLAKVFVERGKCFSLKQVDDVIVAYELGENPLGLRTDGGANLFPVWDGASLFFLCACRFSLGWDVYVCNFDGSRRWDAGFVVLFRN